MLLELAIAAAAAYGADKAGLINLGGGKRAPRSTAPVPSAQVAGMTVAPSIPGHVIPAPSPVDLKAVDASGFAGSGLGGGLMQKLSDNLRATSGQGAPYADAQGYWRDFSTGALYQFRDPNTNRPMGKPGYMPLRYQQYAQAQDASLAAQAAAASADPSADPAATAAQVVQTGLSVAGTAATVAAVATGSSAAATAATVAGVAGSVLACLGPLPVGPLEGWSDLRGKLFRAYDGDRSLQITVTESPAVPGAFLVLAVEVAAEAAMMLEIDAMRASEALYADHRHCLVGLRLRIEEAVFLAEVYQTEWRKARQREREARHATSHANACGCEGIEAR